MISPLDTILAARLLGIGINPQRYQGSTSLACDLGNPKPLNLGSFKHNPKQTETTFQTCFSNAFQLGILASELQGSRSSLVVLSSKPLVISPKQVVAEHWAGPFFQKDVKSQSPFFFWHPFCRFGFLKSLVGAGLSTVLMPFSTPWTALVL